LLIFSFRFKQIHDTHNVSCCFPPETDEKSTILVVYDPLPPSASSSLDEKKKHLDEVTKEILKMAKDVADIKTEIIDAEKKWHEAIVGKNGTTLNA
jgi:hypothetical protein